ncbi:phosphate uptake regulator PhoU [Candidatus Woesearchaeota archaeon]|nr:phosphate uptake regulator PhoU [Candidatus Woesearchaeota archaeon]
MATARKIIQLGEDTLVVSLPSAWARHHSLKKGDELEAEEQGPKLVLYPKSEAKPGRAVVDVSGTGAVARRVLGALYKAGYDEMEIRFESQKELQTIQQTVRDSFVGFEVVSRTKGLVIARNVSEPKHDEFDTLIRRVFLLLLEMGDGCFKSLLAGNFDEMQKVAEIDNDINRYVNFCRRTLNTIGHRVVARVAPTYYMVEQLERAGDCYKHLCATLAETQPGTKKWLSDLLADANYFVRKFYGLYYRFDLQALAEFWSEKDRLEKSIVAASEVAGKKELAAVFAISELVSNIAGANGALLTSRL